MEAAQNMVYLVLLSLLPLTLFPDVFLCTLHQGIHGEGVVQWAAVAGGPPQHPGDGSERP